MPYRMYKVKGGYRVVSPNGVKAHHTSHVNAVRQIRLLRGIAHGMKIRRK